VGKHRDFKFGTQVDRR